MLELRNIAVSYGMIDALKGISLRVEQGEIVALIGANGAGKSTTLMAISGVAPLHVRYYSLSGSFHNGHGFARDRRAWGSPRCLKAGISSHG